MKKLLLISGLICIALFKPFTVAAQVPNIYISEIVYDSPLEEDKINSKLKHNDGEYIKLYNPTSQTVNLTGWTLRGTGYTEQFTFPANTFLQPQSIVLVTYKCDVNFNFKSFYQLGSAVQVYEQSSIILYNNGESLRLYDKTNTLVDAIAYGVCSPTVSTLYAHNSDNPSPDISRLMALIRSQVTYKNGKPGSIGKADLKYGNAAPITAGNALVYNSTPDIPIITTTPTTPTTPTIPYVEGSNYIKTTTYLEKSTSGTFTTLITDQYFDGLGRPIETVQRGITPTSNDLVTRVEYDGVGREFKNHLPVPVSPSNAYVSSSSINPGNIYGESPAYTEVGYEPSPLNRISSQHGPGAWASHPVRFSYDTNSGDIANFTANGTLSLNGNYAPGTLYVNSTTDEDGKIVKEYKDKLGQVILKRSNDGKQNIDTYFVYNDLGQLCYVIPPMAVGKLTGSSISDDNVILKQFCYLYKYDGRGNCIEKRLPACDPIYMIYDNADRMVFSQDGNQRNRTPKQWTVIKYDALSRVTYTGTKVSANPPTDYSNVTKLVENFYDDYNFLSNQNSAFTMDDTKGFDSQYSSAKGLLTGTRTLMLDGGNKYLTKVLYYDYKGQVVQTREDNHLGGFDNTYNAYDFTGNVKRTLKEHGINGQSSTISELYTHTYDRAGRLTKTTYSLNGGAEITLSDMSAPDSYDELGRLKTKMRHDKADTETFEYNIRNWPTKITSGGFEEELRYHSGLPSGVKACYNGNIAYSTWKYNEAKKGYGYIYDNLNRLTHADHYINGATQYSYNEYFQYDKMGNINYLERSGSENTIDYLNFTYNGNQITAIMDDFTSQNSYNVKEYQDKAGNSQNEMAYDVNGNLIKDLDRDIVTIKYNLLNLPDIIQFKNGNQITNKYDAGGRKLSTRYFTLSTPIVVPIGQTCVWEYDLDNIDETGTFYIDNKEYGFNGCDPGVYWLDQVYNAEGYADYNYGSFTSYNYYRRDHLGNNREVWNATTNTTVQRTQYYPSGLPWAESTGSGVQNRKYNGKEFVEMHGLDEYDSEARWYYPAIMRTTTIDPLAEKYYSISPYAWCGNNPVKFLDPDGKEGHMFYKKNEVDEQRFALNYRNDNRIHIFSHGNKNGMVIYTDNGKNRNDITLNNPERFGNLMEYSGSKIWSDYLKGENKTSVEVVLHGCETADLAKVLSETYPNVYFTGPNENNFSENNKEVGPYKINFLDFLFIQGEWETYQNAKLNKSTNAESAPPVDRQNGIEQPKDIKEYK